jgi:DNA-binding response OmpR family regulator
MGKKKILVISSWEDFKTVELYLELDGHYSIEHAFDGQEGMEKFQDSHPRLVIMSYALPKISGTEVLKRIRMVDEKIPIIIFGTYAHSLEWIEKEFENIKITRKPILKENFLSLVKQMTK